MSDVGLSVEPVLRAGFSVEPVLQALLSSGSVIVNDYTITLSEITGGHRLTVSQGSDVQTADIMDGIGVGTPHNGLAERDAADAHPMSAITGLQAALNGYVAKQQGVENIGKIMKVDANGELNLANFYTVVANDQGGNTLTI